MALVSRGQHVAHALDWFVKVFTTSPSDNDTIQAVAIVDGNGDQITTFGGGGGVSVDPGTRHTGSMTAAVLAAGFANLLTPGVAIRRWRIDNFTDGDVVYSLDGGTTTHGTIAPGKSAEENYGQNFLEMTDAIHVKDGTKVATTGTVYAIAYSG